MSLEHQLKTLSGRKYAMATRSGSAAIVAALHASDLPRGSQVVMPAICCPAVMAAIQWAGFSVAFADVNLDTLCSGASEFEAVLTDDTSALIAVHSFGYPCPIEDIVALGQKRGLVVIEDACLGVGGTLGSSAYGSFGDASIFSFGYDKIVDGGGGGAVLCDDEKIASAINQFLAANPYLVEHPASEITHGLTTLTQNLECRRQNSARFHTELASERVHKPYLGNVIWRYTALYKGDRASLVEQAAKENLIITTHYPSLGAFKTGQYLPNATQVAQQVINLFVRQGTPASYIDDTIAFINQY